MMSCVAPTAFTSVSDHFVTLNAWIKKHEFGKFMIPTQHCHSPQSTFRARVALPADVAKLEASFMKFTSVHDQSVCVVFWPPESKLPQRRNFNLNNQVMNICNSQGGFFFVVGDHTQLAVHRLNRKYPKNKLWSAIPAIVLLCHRTVENEQRLKSWGILDNVKGQKRTFVSFASKLFSLHEDYVNLLAVLDPDDKTWTPSLMTLKKNRMEEYDLNSNSFGQVWGLATKTGAVWDCLEKIVKGEVTVLQGSKAFKTPRSASNFTQMGNIPDVDLAVLLQQVVDGEKSLTEFTLSCRFYKASARVQSEILCHSKISGSSWVESQADWTHACSSSFVQMWADHIVTTKLGARKPLPSRFFEMLESRIVMDETIQDAVSAQDGASYIYFSVSCDTHQHSNINTTMFASLAGGRREVLRVQNW